MYPIVQDYLSSVSRKYRPTGYERTRSATMLSSFRQGGLDPVVTVLALVEGFGPGWTADEVCQLALQALRNQFVQAEGGDGDDVLRVLHTGLAAAHTAVYGRACNYEAEGEIGCQLVVAVLVGSRCLVAQVGDGAALLLSREGNLRPIQPVLTADEGDFLGKNTELSLSTPVAEDEGKNVRLQAGDRILLLNAALLASLKERQIADALARPELERAADKLLRLGQAKDGKQEMATLLVEMPGAVQRAAAILPRTGRALAWGAVALLLIGLLWSVINWLNRPDEPLAALVPTLSPTATIFLPPPTGLPLLPTPIRTATFTPTPTDTVTPSPTASPTATLLPPTEAATETPTPTLLPPTPTDTVSPSPTIPAAPIAVGGRVVVVGTAGLGISLREGPGPTLERLAIIFDGEQLEVIGGPEQVADIVWWQLQTAEGLQGWGAGRYLQGVAY